MDMEVPQHLVRPLTAIKKAKLSLLRDFGSGDAGRVLWLLCEDGQIEKTV
jgi:hypothetical protein